jgi:hypothetical protein
MILRLLIGFWEFCVPLINTMHKIPTICAGEMAQSHNVRLIVLVNFLQPPKFVLKFRTHETFTVAKVPLGLEKLTVQNSCCHIHTPYLAYIFA